MLLKVKDVFDINIAKANKQLWKKAGYIDSEIFLTMHPRLENLLNKKLADLTSIDEEILKQFMRENIIVPRKEYRNKIIKLFFDDEEENKK